MKSLFPHQKLDWTISRMEDRLHATPEDPALRLDFARALLSRALFHGKQHQGDAASALSQARRALSDDPASVDALVIAGLSLIGSDRLKAAAKYLDQAWQSQPEHAELRLALGMMDQVRGDPGGAVRHFEAACRLKPEAWEPHLLLGRSLMAVSRQQGHPRRLLERGQYHLVQALKREPTPDQMAPLLQDLGLACMLTDRFREAEKFFIRLREHERYASTARYQLGLVAYQLGKYNNAIQHFRQYLRNEPDDPKVLARMAMAWFQLGELHRAREACHQALLIDPENIDARHALGCTLLEDGEPGEALKVFRDALRDRPEHLPSYIEMVRTRRKAGDARWMMNALAAEVGNFDRLPVGGRLDARGLTRDRIRVLLDELTLLGPSAIEAALGAIDLTQDEALRFQLWEAGMGMVEQAVADDVSADLREPGERFSAELGARALAAAGSIPEPTLTAGLKLDDRDIKKAANSRHGVPHDVGEFRRNKDLERDQARAYQALLLLSIGLRRSAAGARILHDWADAADSELATAAWTGLAMSGDPEAARRLRHRADQLGALPVVQRLLAQVTPAAQHPEPRRVGDGEHTHCSTCGRKPDEVTHMMTGGDVVVCDLCVVHIRQHRASLSAPDDATCALCGRSPFETSGLYRYNNVDVCASCLQLSLGLLEREEVDQFLATW